MSTEKIKDLWAVGYDDDQLIVTRLETIVNTCHKAFTEPKPRVLRLPVLSVWETEEEANGALERLRAFEDSLDSE